MVLPSLKNSTIFILLKWYIFSHRQDSTYHSLWCISWSVWCVPVFQWFHDKPAVQCFYPVLKTQQYSFYYEQNGLFFLHSQHSTYHSLWCISWSVWCVPVFQWFHDKPAVRCFYPVLKTQQYSFYYEQNGLFFSPQPTQHLPQSLMY